MFNRKQILGMLPDILVKPVGSELGLVRLKTNICITFGSNKTWPSLFLMSFFYKKKKTRI
jgi:hypothetical protein